MITDDKIRPEIFSIISSLFFSAALLLNSNSLCWKAQTVVLLYLFVQPLMTPARKYRYEWNMKMARKTRERVETYSELWKHGKTRCCRDSVRNLGARWIRSGVKINRAGLQIPSQAGEGWCWEMYGNVRPDIEKNQKCGATGVCCWCVIGLTEERSDPPIFRKHCWFLTAHANKAAVCGILQRGNSFTRQVTDY